MTHEEHTDLISKPSIPTIKTITASVANVHTSNLVLVNSSGPSLVKPKRKTLSIKHETIPLPISNPSYLLLSDTTINSSHDLSNDESAGLPDGEIFNQQVSVLPKTNSLEVRSKKRFKLKEMPLLAINIPEINLSNAVINDLKVFRNGGSKFSQYIQFDKHPHLEITHIKESGTLQISLAYKYSIIESLLLQFDNDLINIVKHVITGSKGHSEQQYTAPENHLLYDILTDHTMNYPAPSKPPLVTGLSTDLLQFQGKTVSWMLSRENAKYNFETFAVEKRWDPLGADASDQVIQQRLDELSFGFRPVVIDSPVADQIWFNEYTGNISTTSKVIEYINSIGELGGTGLLCEEMGLGKTVELASLTLLNPRPDIHLSDYYIDDIGRTVKKSKTTLIICPESILEQWADELTNHAAGLKVSVYKGLGNHKIKIPGRAGSVAMSSDELVDFLSASDIVITSYSVVAREVHYASYNPERSKRVRRSKPNSNNNDIIQESESNIEDIKSVQESNSTIDFTSPLVKIEFWRLVLDEAQMVGNGLSNRCKMATLIPRYHSWGVSGTPVKNSLSDLNSLLVFLKFKPFDDLSTWKKLLHNIDDFKKLFGMLGFRHTKEMVKDEIALPGQRRMLMSIPFSAIEQDNYNVMYKEFLQDVGLDETGAPVVEDWNPSYSYYEAMREWLHTLRVTCCHANFDSVFDKHTGKKYTSIEDILQNMISGEEDKVDHLLRNQALARLEIGQVHEFLKNPKDALDVWEPELEKINTIVDDLRKISEKTSTYDTFKSWLEILHRFHFFVASAYHQLYDRSTMSYMSYEERLKIDEDVLISRVPNYEESKHQDLEIHHYAVAQSIRKELLAEYINDVVTAIQKQDQLFYIPLIGKGKSIKFNNVLLNSIRSNAMNTFKTLDEQASVLNEMIRETTKMVRTPLLDTVTTPSGEEYAESLYSQSSCSVYLEVIQASMKNRDVMLLGASNGEFYEKVESLDEARSMNDQEHDEMEVLKRVLEDRLPSAALTHSLKGLATDMKYAMTKVEGDPVDLELAQQLELSIKKELTEQRKISDAFKKKFRSLNDTYNLKIKYFRQLQVLSDNVVSFTEETHDISQAEKMIARREEDIKRLQLLIDRMRSRIRYLQTLSSNHDPAESEKICIICRSSITIGSLLKCGHKYCKDCLSTWLKTKSTCPICKQVASSKDIYHFTYNRKDIDVSSAIEHKGKRDEEIAEIYEKSEKKSLSLLNDIPLVQNYGAKVDAIVRQILWLKRQDEYVQIVVYSQWAKFLKIIAKSLKENGITFVGTDKGETNNIAGMFHGTKDQLMSNVSLFKKNPRITCFLLNARADASGLNLINATHVFICEPLVQTALESQAISRIHRIGQKKPTTIWMFAISGTVEENIVLLASRKRMREREKFETEEMSKSSKTLVAKSGEIVETDDLWNSFFSMQTDHFS